VQNYLGFPDGVSGDDLLAHGRAQAERFGSEFAQDEIADVGGSKGDFTLEGKSRSYHTSRLLLATGIYHVPPDIDGVEECLGHSMFFCKDCDGVRVEGKPVGIYGWSNETVEYALAMLLYSPTVAILTDGRKAKWDAQHQAWIEAYCIPTYTSEIRGVNRCGHQLKSLLLADGTEVMFDALFTTRGDVYFNRLAKDLGAQIDDDGEIVVDQCQATSVPGVYAAGCVTPANCQIIIAAGQGAVAAQAINRDLFEESLATRSLRRYREKQLREEPSLPVVNEKPVESAATLNQ
jgi:thioredoxin reductase (NADPH)